MCTFFDNTNFTDSNWVEGPAFDYQLLFSPITLTYNCVGISCQTKTRQFGLYKRGWKSDSKDRICWHWYREEEIFDIPCICDAASRKAGSDKSLWRLLEAFWLSLFVNQLCLAQLLLWVWIEPSPAKVYAHPQMTKQRMMLFPTHFWRCCGLVAHSQRSLAGIILCPRWTKTDLFIYVGEQILMKQLQAKH